MPRPRRSTTTLDELSGAFEAASWDELKREYLGARIYQPLIKRFLDSEMELGKIALADRRIALQIAKGLRVAAREHDLPVRIIQRRQTVFIARDGAEPS